MGLPYSGPVTNPGTCCEPVPGSQAPDLAPYVRSLESLQGIITFGDTGAITWSTVGNTIYADLTAEAGQGSVTSVGVSSTTLTVGSSPVTTSGTITVNLTGATASIHGLTTAANKMIYTTASNVYAVTDLSPFARTILDDTSAEVMRSSIEAQQSSSILDDVVNNMTWTGTGWELTGDFAVPSGNAQIGGALIITGTASIGGALGMNFNSINEVDDITATGDIQAANFSGNGSALTGLDAGNVSTGTLTVARGGTGQSSYAVGDILYASASTSFTKLASVAAGSFLRSSGVATAPAWSTLKLPNAATTGDLLYASSANTMANLADVATGNALISGGVGVAPSWGKVTASHTTGLAASGNNSDIVQLSALTSVQSAVAFGFPVTLEDALYDKDAYEGQSGALLTSTVTGIQWLRSVNVDSIRIDVGLSTEGTLTGAGFTGNKTINKMSGSVRFAAAATSITVTNSLVTADSRVLAMTSTNDSTAYVKNVVVSSGSFVITLGAAATAETEVSWLVFTVT